MGAPSRLSVLFGSGVSIPAGYPDTGTLTKMVLSGDRAFLHTDNLYYLAEAKVPPDSGLPVRLVVAFLKVLAARVDEFYATHGDHRTNYEDVFYLAKQLEDMETGEFDNPVVQPFALGLIPHVERFVREFNAPGITSPVDLYRQAVNYVQDVVRHGLAAEPSRTDHLALLAEASGDPSVLGLDIFTLNHDVLLETALQSQKLSFADGFSQPISDLRYWEPSRLDRQDLKVRLFKLHGSTNWFRFRPPDNSSWKEILGIPVNSDPWHCFGRDGQYQTPVNGRPVILVGTFNKILEYSSGVFAYLHNAFRATLAQNPTLVVCGYGFRDKGINSTIANWLFSTNSKRLIVIHPDPDGLIRGARGAIANNWRLWVDSGVAATIPLRIENVSWKDIQEKAS